MQNQSGTTTEAYSREQWVLAVNASAVFGWVAVAVPISLGGHSVIQMLGVLLWAGIIGLPIAFLSVWIIGASILKHVMRRPVTWARAALWGGIIALAIAMASIIVARLRGYQRYLDPNSFSQLGGGDRVREIDGILTAYGWWVTAQNTAQFVVAGVVIALIIRAFIGPGRTV